MKSSSKKKTAKSRIPASEKPCDYIINGNRSSCKSKESDLCMRNALEMVQDVKKDTLDKESRRNKSNKNGCEFYKKQMVLEHVK